MSIFWKGLDWTIRPDGQGGPANNHWRGNNVVFDANDNLHIKITKQGGLWTCGQISTAHLLGYGVYKFVLASPVNFDKNIVAAGFTYLDDKNELDIEFSKWADDNWPNTGFTVQPGPYVEGVNNFNFDLPNDVVGLTCIIEHYPHGDIRFVINNPETGTSITHLYKGSHVPAELQKFMFNIWLVNGIPPSDLKETEMVISDFQFTPMPVNENEVEKAVADLRAELASQKKLSQIRSIVNSTKTATKKVNEIKVIV